MGDWVTCFLKWTEGVELWLCIFCLVILVAFPCQPLVPTSQCSWDYSFSIPAIHTELFCKKLAENRRLQESLYPDQRLPNPFPLLGGQNWRQDPTPTLSRGTGETEQLKREASRNYHLGHLHLIIHSFEYPFIQTPSRYWSSAYYVQIVFSML